MTPAQPSGTGSPEQLAPGLHVVATPIGNLGDTSDRARFVLGRADLVLAEDTRVTAKLLHRFGIKARTQPYHDHNGDKVRPGVLAALDRGAAVALVSDAGTPCIADPGYKLVRAVRGAGHPVFAVPGPSSIVAALSIAGLPTDRFFFQGFLPAKAAARAAVLDEMKRVPGTLVLLEAPHRLAATLDAAAAALGAREAAIARELTKRHEEVKVGRLDDLAAAYAGGGAPRGEIVLLIGPAEAPPAAALEGAALEAALIEATARLGPSRAAADLAKQTGRKRADLYALALKGRSS